MRDIARRVDKLEEEIGRPEGCETCKEYDGIPVLSDAETERAVLNEYAANAAKPPGVIQTVAYKVLCKDCRRPYVQLVHVEYVKGGR